MACILAFTLKKKPLKPALFTVVKSVILNHRLELLLLCCAASPGAVYLSNSQLLSSHLALCGVVTYYWPQILSQATPATQLKCRLNPI